jgi:hypothetical protein
MRYSEETITFLENSGKMHTDIIFDAKRFNERLSTISRDGGDIAQVQRRLGA